MRYKYQKWILWSAIVTTLLVVGMIGMLVWITHTANTNIAELEKCRDIFEMVVGTNTNMKDIVSSMQTYLGFVIGGNALFAVLCFVLAFMDRQKFIPIQNYVNVFIIIMIFVSGISLVSMIFYFVGQTKAIKEEDQQFMEKLAESSPQQQLAIATAYAEKLKILRDRGDISQEQFLAEIN